MWEWHLCNNLQEMTWIAVVFSSSTSTSSSSSSSSSSSLLHKSASENFFESGTTPSRNLQLFKCFMAVFTIRNGCVLFRAVAQSSSHSSSNESTSKVSPSLSLGIYVSMEQLACSSSHYQVSLVFIDVILLSKWVCKCK